MKLAYLILAHRYPDQLVRLVDRLDDDGVTFLIHLDAKMDSAMSGRIFGQLAARRNVLFTRRFKCCWAGYGIVQATFQGIREAIERKVEFDYLALLSGQDYPIKTNRAIRGFLAANEGASFVHYNPFPYNNGWERIERWHFVGEKRIFTFPDRHWFRRYPKIRFIWRAITSVVPARPFPSGIHPCGGAQFWCMHKAHVDYVYRFVLGNPDFFCFFRFVYVPDEILFQTIIGNSPFTDEVVSETLTYVEWYRPGAVLVDSDFPTIWSTGHLFARKFDPAVDAGIVDRIDREILDSGGGAPAGGIQERAASLRN